MDLQEKIQLEINEINNSRVGIKSDKQLYLFLKARPIKQYSLKGEFIAEYPSKAYAEKKLGIQKGGLDKAFNTKKINSYGFIWRYSDEELIMKPIRKSGPKKPFIQIYHISGEKLSTVTGIKGVCEFFNVIYTKSNISRISKCLNGNAKTFNKHFVLYEDKQKEKLVLPISKTQAQTIEQYTIEGELIATYSTLTDAAKILGYNRSKLKRYINFKNGKYNSFIFKVLNHSNQE